MGVLSRKRVEYTTAMVTNVHGRKGGRGARPYWLIAKLVGVAMYLGGLTSGLAIVLTLQPTTAEQWTQLADTLRAIFVFAAVPGLLLAIVGGVVLLRINPVLWRMRWVKLKVLILVVVIPVLHWMTSTWVGTLRITAEELAQHDKPVLGINRDVIAILFGSGIVLTLVVVVLGRYKPRLGQRVTTLAEQRAAQEGKPLKEDEA